MVYTAPEDKDLLIRVNIPFEAIPVGMLRLARVDEGQFIQNASWLNQAYWNLSYWTGDMIWAILWGQFDPVDRLMHVVKFIIHPALHQRGTEMYRRALSDVRLFGSHMQAEKIYWLTTRPRTYLKKLDGYVKISDTTVIEVI